MSRTRSLSAASRPVMLAVLLAAGQIAGASPIAAPPVAAAGVSEFAEQTVLSGLTNPTIVRFAADGRVFVGEKSGVVKVFDDLSDPTPTLFADLRTAVHNFWDRGLLGLALAPTFPADPSVYVLYTYDHVLGDVTAAPRWGTAGATSDGCPTPPGATTDGCVVSARLSRLPYQGGIAGPEQVLIEDWCSQYPSHTIGDLAFGPDGMLYASAGDGASFTFADYGQAGSPRNPCGDPPVGTGGTQQLPGAEGGALRAQDLRTSGDPVGLDGTLIRIDPATGQGAVGNPGHGSSDANAARVVAHGFRNPFRFTVRPGTSEIWIGDVGSTKAEEINRVVDVGGQVENFGWPCYEGGLRHAAFDVLDLTVCEDLYAAGSAAHTTPVFAYGRHESVLPDDGCPVGSSSITGLAFAPEGGPYGAGYDGALFWADYSRDCIFVMPRGAAGQPDPALREVLLAGASNPVYITTGPGGYLYSVDMNGGRVTRIIRTDPNDAPTAVLQADPLEGPVPLTVTLDAGGSHDPDGDDLSFAWDLDGDGQEDDASGPTVQWTYGTAGDVTVRVRVADPGGGTDTASVVVRPGASAPTAVITAPGPDLRWQVDDLIEFSGHGSDAQDGDLPATALRWELLIEHCPLTCHTHVYQSWEGVDGGSFRAPDHEHPSFLRLRLTATDSTGSTSQTTIDLHPSTVEITFLTDPAGLPLVVDGDERPAPFSRRVIVGSRTSVAAPETSAQGERWTFAGWSHGAAASHELRAPPTDTTYVATFREVPDTTPPTVNSPVVMPRRASVVTSLPVTVSWTSSDVGSGIVATELHTSVDGGAWRAVKLASATGSSVNTSMPTSGSVRYRVRVRDAAGNWSPWRYSVSLKGRLYQESYRWIRWSGSWSSRASSDWSGGAARVSVSPNSYSVFSFTGRSVAWVARTGPTMGLVRVSVDGVHAATVDLYSPTPGYRSVRYSQTWATSATHQLTLRNMATPGRPATEVDALIVLH